MRISIVLVLLGACAWGRGDAHDSDGPVGVGASIDGSIGSSDGSIGSPDARAFGFDAGPGPARTSCAGASDVADVATWDATWEPTWIHLAWIGSAYAVVFYVNPSGSAPHGGSWLMEMGADGALVPGSARQVAPGGVFARVAWSGSELAVVYSRYSTSQASAIHLARFDAQLAPIPGGDVIVSDDGAAEFGPAVAWDPIDRIWGVAWSDGAVNGHASFARVSASGELLGGTTPIDHENDLTGPVGLAGEPLAWAGDRFALAWTAPSAVHVSTITGAGEVAMPVTIPTTPIDAYASIAIGDAGWGVAWAADPATDYTVHFARASASGYVAGSDVPLDGDLPVYDDPSIAWNGHEFGVQWGRNPSGAFFLARLSAAGARLETRELDCTSLGDGLADVAGDGARWLIPFTRGVTGHTLVYTPPGGPQ